MSGVIKTVLTTKRKVNFFLMEFGVATLEGTESPTCDHCGQTPVVFCVECKEYLCGALLVTHKTGRKTSSHQLQEFKKTIPPKLQVQIIELKFLMDKKLYCRRNSIR